MPLRMHGTEDEADAIRMIVRRLQDLETTQQSRTLPPGYSFNIVDGDLVIRRADGATATLVFA